MECPALPCDQPPAPICTSNVVSSGDRIRATDPADGAMIWMMSFGEYGAWRCQVDERRVLMTSGRRRFLCDISNCGDLMPGAEGGVAYGTVLVGGEAMAAELEVVVDAGVGGQELLGVAR